MWRNVRFETKQILTMTEKQSVKNIKQIREKINLNDVENESLIDVDVEPNIINENKINTKILYEGEMNLRFIFVNQRMQIDIKETKIEVLLFLISICVGMLAYQIKKMFFSKKGENKNEYFY